MTPTMIVKDGLVWTYIIRSGWFIHLKVRPSQLPTHEEGWFL